MAERQSAIEEALAVLCEELESEGVDPADIVDALLAVAITNGVRLSGREELALWLERAATQIRAAGFEIGSVN